MHRAQLSGSVVSVKRGGKELWRGAKKKSSFRPDLDGRAQCGVDLDGDKVKGASAFSWTAHLGSFEA